MVVSIKQPIFLQHFFDRALPSCFLNQNSHFSYWPNCRQQKASFYSSGHRLLCLFISYEENEVMWIRTLPFAPIWNRATFHSNAITFIDFQTFADFSIENARPGSKNFRVEKFDRSYSVLENDDLKLSCVLANRCWVSKKTFYSRNLRMSVVS